MKCTDDAKLSLNCVRRREQLAERFAAQHKIGPSVADAICRIGLTARKSLNDFKLGEIGDTFLEPPIKSAPIQICKSFRHALPLPHLLNRRQRIRDLCSSFGKSYLRSHVATSLLLQHL